MPTALQNIFRFILLVLLQVLVLNNIQFMGYINPYLYILFILSLPYQTPKWFVLLLGFRLGLTIDVCSNTMGMHAFATVFVAFLRGGTIKLFTSIEEYRHIPLNMKNTLIQLNIADDYFKAKDQVEKLERDLENKEKEIYDLKHDLISNQVKTETAEESLKKLERDNKELLLNKARLEAALEDKLLDGKDSPKESEKENIKK